MDTKDLDRYLTGHWGEDSVPSQDEEQEIAGMIEDAKWILKLAEVSASSNPLSKTDLLTQTARKLARQVLSYFGESE